MQIVRDVSHPRAKTGKAVRATVLASTIGLGALALASCGSETDKGRNRDAAGVSTIASNITDDCSNTAPAQTRGDVIGVHPGQSVEKVAEVLKCNGGLVDIGFGEDLYGLPAEPIKFREKIVATSGTPCEFDPQQWIRQQGGGSYSCRKADFESSRYFENRNERLLVALVGMPGEETVAGVWRTREYAEDDSPVVEDAVASLTGKYGEPHIRENRGRGEELIWIFDLQGRPMSEANPAYNRCRGIAANQEQRQSWTSDCGLTIEALVERQRSNNLLAAAIHVGSVDQAALFAGVEAMRQGIARAQQQQQQSEVDAARSNNGGVEL